MSRFAIRAGVHQRGLGPPAWRRAIGLAVMILSAIFVIAAMLSLTACAATQDHAAIAATAPGFWLGLWHGFIFPVAWVISLFTSQVAIYAVPNAGGWYDFGYFVGIVFLGVGARKSRVIYKDRVINVRARRIQE
jgi:hypothetical protein